MNEDKARVPTLVLCGGTPQQREAAIAQLTGPVAGGHAVAVLRAGGGMFASAGAPLERHVVVKWAPIGCLCCTAGVVFRAALITLLKASRPARLVVDLGPGAHVPTLAAELRGESMGRSVRVVASVDLDAPGPIEWPV
jgi:hypothetical protein